MNNTEELSEDISPVLNWTPAKQNYAGLREALQECFVAHPPRFSAVRLGGKWADSLQPGDRVAISISEEPEEPSIIGYAMVLSTRKAILDLLERDKIPLDTHIGAKTWAQVLEDLRDVHRDAYNRRDITKASIVSIIDFLAEQGLSKSDIKLLNKTRKSLHPDLPVS